MPMNHNDGFYEDDEPIEQIRTAFDRGEKGVTANRPRDLNRLAASIVAEATADQGSDGSGLVPAPSPEGFTILNGLRLTKTHVAVDSGVSVTVG